MATVVDVQRAIGEGLRDIGVVSNLGLVTGSIQESGTIQRLEFV